jgi:hypothetical protein
MTFDIKFDYRFDEFKFFTPERKKILNLAAKIWSSHIRDEFDPIAAGETLKFSIDSIDREVTLDKSIDDLLIFVSSVSLSSNELTLGEGAYYAQYILGSDRESRIQGDNFEPWVGTIEFNSLAKDSFYFDTTPTTDDDIPFDQQDFFSLALHEIGHVLGFGTAPIFREQIKNNKFIGSQSIDFNGGKSVPLDEGGTHIKNGYSLDPNSDALLDPFLTFGERNLPTSLDLALLTDIGYDVFAYDKTEVYRFYQYNKGFHFYTADENERQSVLDRSKSGELQYNYENQAYSVLTSDRDSLTGQIIEYAQPIYRFFNRQTGAHLYTMDEREKNNIIDNLKNYNDEGVAYYAFESQPENIDTVPLYRMLNTQSGAHLFTTSRNEFDTIQETLPNFQAEGNEGVAFYVFE